MASKVIFLVCSAVLLITTNISLAETKLSSAIENKNLVPVFGGFYDLDAKSFAIQAGTYAKTFPFNENGLALSIRWRKNEYIDRAGNIVEPTDGSESIKIAERNERMAYVNYQGEALTSFIYYYLSEFKNGIGVGKAHGYVSLIYADGTVIELPHVSELRDFAANGLAIASKNEKFGFINRQGQTIVPIKFDNAQDFTANGLAAVKMGAKWGFVNEQGEIAIPIQFEHADSFAPNGLAAVQTSNGWGYINIKGEVVIADRFSYSRNFLENGLAVAQLGGKYLLINQQGKQVSSFSFTDHKELSSKGYLGVKSSEMGASKSSRRISYAI